MRYLPHLFELSCEANEERLRESEKVEERAESSILLLVSTNKILGVLIYYEHAAKMKFQWCADIPTGF